MAAKIPMKCEEGFVQPFEVGDFIGCAYLDPSCSGGAGGGITEAQLNAAIAAAVAALRAGVPAALDTLNELAAAIGNDSAFAAHMATALAGKIPYSAAGVPNGVGTLDAGGHQPPSEAARTETAQGVSSVAGVLTIDWNVANMFTLILSENITSVVFVNKPAVVGLGQGITLLVQQGAATAYTIAGWPAVVKWFGGAYAVSPTLNAIDEVAFSTYGTDVYGKYLQVAA